MRSHSEKQSYEERGSHATLVANLLMLHKSVAAAEQLANEESITVGVIDPWTRAPLDVDTIFHSVRKTGRLIVVEECQPTGGRGNEVIASVCERLHGLTMVKRIGTSNTPIPYAESLVNFVVPTVGRIKEGIRDALKNGLAPRQGCCFSPEEKWMAAIIMPQFGETAGEEIKIAKWKKSIGDEVKAGDSLLEVDTEKSTLDVEAADSGRLAAIEKKAGDIVHTGEIIAIWKRKIRINAWYAVTSIPKNKTQRETELRKKSTTCFLIVSENFYGFSEPHQLLKGIAHEKWRE